MECELKDITVHYESFGEGRPLVALHGWGMDHRYMVSDLEPLFGQRDGWRRIYPDLPGHGMTPGPDWIKDRDQELDVVLDFVDAVIPGERFAVAGSSAGAYMARGVVHRRPAAIDGVLLTVPSIIAERAAERQIPTHVTLAADPAIASELTPDEAEGLFGIIVVQDRKVLDYFRANVPSAETGDEAYQERVQEGPGTYNFSFDVDALAEPCSAPTLIVTGRQDSVIGYRDAWGILENYPRGTFVVLDRAGHFMAVEQEDLFHALAGEWLDRVEECAGV
jgi:pimeloyl-ACP methyl ester carboxylesterase